MGLLDPPALTRAQGDDRYARTSAAGSLATDHGFVGWTLDPIQCTSTTAFAAGTLYAARLRVASDTITNIIVPIITAGTGLTSSWAAVYKLDGTLLGATTDQGASWNTSGQKTIPLTAPVTGLSPGGLVLLSILSVGTTGPTLRCNVASVAINFNIPAASGYRSGSLAGQVGMPSPLAVGTMTSAQQMPLLAVI